MYTQSLFHYLYLVIFMAVILCPTAQAETTQPTTPRTITIDRIIPCPAAFLCEWTWHGNTPPADIRVTLEWKRLDGKWPQASALDLDPAQTSARIEGLASGVDYEVRIRTRPASDDALQSATRRIRPGSVPGVVIDYLHPGDETYAAFGRYIGSPSLAVLPGGDYVASHDLFGGKGASNDLTRIFISRDRGASWQFLSEVRPSFWGKLFVHRDRLYLLTVTHEYGDLFLYRSGDGGRTWGEPVKLHDAPCHKAPMPVVEHNGRLWTAFETHPAPGWSPYTSHVLSVAADADLMDPASWTASQGLALDREWPGMLADVGDPGFIEGNVVVTPEGNLVNIMRYNSPPHWGKAFILNIDAENPAAPETFARVIDLPGGMSKFCIHRDADSGRYLSLVNRVTRDINYQRNVLSLVSSADLINWKLERDVIDYANGDRYTDSDWDMLIGFQYVDWLFEGDEMIAISRTALGGANNFHDANHLTFHRFEK